jgi:hypothetical protein
VCQFRDASVEIRPHRVRVSTPVPYFNVYEQIQREDAERDRESAHL